MNMRDFIEELKKTGDILTVRKKVDPKYEISSIIHAAGKHPIMFTNVKGYDYKVVANICATRELTARGLGVDVKDIMNALQSAVEHPVEPAVKKTKAYRSIGNDLSKLPVLKYYKSDGGPYIASGVVIANDSEYGLNASFHRAMVIGKDKVVMRILERDFFRYIERGLKEFAFCISNPVPVLVASAISADITTNELAVANALSETPLVSLGGHMVPEAEIVMIMELTDETANEGAFVDLTGTQDIVRQQRVARVKSIFVRENPYFHALLPGGFEHKVLMGMPRETTIFREVKKVAHVKDVRITPGGCSWLHGVVSIRKEADTDMRKVVDAAFKGHRSMKHVFIVDDDIDIDDPTDVEWALATRFQGNRDMIIYREKGSSLDPSADDGGKVTDKVGFDLTVPMDRNKEDFRKVRPPMDVDLNDYVTEERHNVPNKRTRRHP